MRRFGTRLLAGGAVWLLLGCAFSTSAFAQQVTITAKVDKTRVDLGTPLTLTITIEGDFAQVNLKPIQFPKVFQVVAESRSSNLSFETGGLKRSVSLIYVLAGQEAGTFQLGPFQIMHQGKPIQTDPIAVVVNKPILPPNIEGHERYVL